MIETVINKINMQQKGKENTAVYMIGEQLKDICRESLTLAEIVNRDLDMPEMSIEKAERKIKEWADKQKRIGNCVCVPPDVAEKIIREFYGLPERGRNAQTGRTGHIDLASFL